jgi:HEAT repeat protein
VIAALGDDNGFVREAAARALGAIGGAAAIAALERAQSDADAGVAGAARESLARLRRKK